MYITVYRIRKTALITNSLQLRPVLLTSTMLMPCQTKLCQLKVTLACVNTGEGGWGWNFHMKGKVNNV